MLTHRSSRRVLFVMFVLMPLFALPAFAQTNCVILGTITDCSGSNGQSATQMQLGSNLGVVMTPQGTEPYTIITPNQARPFNPAPLPTLPSPGMTQMPQQPTSTMNPMLLPGSGLDGPVMILGR